MAHEITEFDNMSYVGEHPWHGLGHMLPQGASVQEMVQAAGLDWSVDLVEIPHLPGFENLSDKRNMVVRRLPEGNNLILDYVGDRFTPIQNISMFEVMDSYCRANGLTMETAGSLKAGQIVWGLAKIPNGRFSLVGGDEIAGYLLLINSHRMGKAFAAFWSSVRVVCNNTLTMALKNAEKDSGGRVFKHSHASVFDEFAKGKMDQTLEINRMMTGFKEQAEFLASVKMSERQQVKFLSGLFAPGLEKLLVDTGNRFPTSFESLLSVNKDLLPGKNSLRRLVEELDTNPKANPGRMLVSANNTAWGMLNTVTWAKDHYFGQVAANNNDKQAKRESRQFQLATGPAAKTKLLALSMLMDFAKAA